MTERTYSIPAMQFADANDDCKSDTKYQCRVWQALAKGYDAGKGEQEPFEKMLTEQIEWSRKTFGPSTRTQGILDHIYKELEEIKADPGDAEEWTDVMILAFDGAQRLGLSAREIMDGWAEKMLRNYERQWPAWQGRDDHAIEHIRDVTLIPRSEWIATLHQAERDNS